MVLKIFLVTIVFLGLAFAGFAIKMFVKKDGEFKKQCSSVNPNTGERYGCVCGEDGDEACENKTKINVPEIEIETLQTK
jgi:hypothetical protein